MAEGWPEPAPGGRGRRAGGGGGGRGCGAGPPRGRAAAAAGAGLVLLAAGAALAGGAGAAARARAGALAPLRGAAAEWGAAGGGGRAAFARLAGAVAARDDFPAGASEAAGRAAGPSAAVPLAGTSEPLVGPWEPGTRGGPPLPPYEPLKYQAQGTFNWSLSLAEDRPDVHGSPQVKAPHVNVTVTLGGAEVALRGVPLYRHEARPLGVKQCRLHHGVLLGGVCHDLHVLAGVCVQVSRGPSGDWALAEVPGGCTPGSSYPWRSASHRGQVSYRAWRGKSLSQIGVLFTVRSTEDPYLTAYAASSGSMFFGDSGRDRWTKAAVCFTAGGALILPLALLQGLRALDRRAKGQAWLKYHSSDSENEDEAEELRLL